MIARGGFGMGFSRYPGPILKIAGIIIPGHNIENFFLILEFRKSSKKAG